MSSKVVCVDLLEFLLTNPKVFQSLPQSQKREIVSKRSTPHIDIVHYEDNKVIQFDPDWYTSYDWLTGSLHRNKLYCFPCLLFDESAQSSEIFTSIKNFHKKARAHEISKSHIKNKEQFVLLMKNTDPYSVEEIHQKDLQFKIRRNTLKKYVQLFSFVNKNKNHFLTPSSTNYMKNAVDYLASNDINFSYNWESNCKNLTTPDAHKEILELLSESVNLYIKDEISKCDFVSVQIDEMSDVTSKPTFSIIFRYVVECKICERFAGYHDLPEDQSGDVYYENVMNIIREWGAEDKLVCVSYDSNNTKLPISRLQERNILTLHNASYNLHSVLLKSAIVHPDVKEFAGYVVTVMAFFSDPKRETRLHSEGYQIPKEFSEPGSSLETYIWIIKTKFFQLDSAIKYILESGNWDLETTCLAKFVYDIFQNDIFVYLLCVFVKIFVIADHLTCILRIISFKNLKLCRDEVANFLSNLKDIQSPSTLRKIHSESLKILPVFKAKNRQLNLNKLTEEILRLISYELETRFVDHAKLKSFELIDEQKYPEYGKSFPYKRLSDLSSDYAFFDLEKLQNELSLIYEDTLKHLPARDLLNHLNENSLTDVYEESAKLIRLFLTLPVYVAEENAELRTYEKVKKFARCYDSLDMFKTQGVLLVENAALETLLKDETFMDGFVQSFAQKTKQENFYY